MKKVLLFLLFNLPFVLLQHQAYAAVFEGIVKPVSELELSFAIDGVISKILVKEGDLVKKGDLLIKLDDTLQKLEVERRKQIYQDQAEMEANKKNLVILKSLLDSNRTLYEKTASVSYDELRNIEMQYHTLLGKVNLNEEKKKQEQIEYEISKEMLSRYIITAPMDGMVTSIKREESEWVKTGETMLILVDTSVCHVEFNIDEKYARKMIKGRMVSLRVREGDSMTAKKGKILFVSPVADKASALVKVKVEFENRTGSVIPGVLANIYF